MPRIQHSTVTVVSSTLVELRMYTFGSRHMDLAKFHRTAQSSVLPLVCLSLFVDCAWFMHEPHRGVSGDAESLVVLL